MFAITSLGLLPVWLVAAFLVVAFEESDRYVEAAAVTVPVVLVMGYMAFSPVRPDPPRGAVGGGREVDRARALEATYAWARGAVARRWGRRAVWIALLLVVVGAIAGASGSRLVQYGIVGAAFGAVSSLVVLHSFMEATMRPARIAIAGDTGIGDALPRSRPTFAAWSNVSMLAVAFTFAVVGSDAGSGIPSRQRHPVLLS